MSSPSQYNLTGVFNEQSSQNKKKSKGTTKVSIRVTEEEKALLEQMAGTVALAQYIRKRLFGNDTAERPKRYTKKQRKPDMNLKDTAQILGMFGQSELAKAVLGLSNAAQAGKLDVSPDVQDKIETACEEIHTIKMALIFALGVKPQRGDG